MNLETFKINNENEDEEQDYNRIEPILPNHFLGLLVGKPGQGKSSLISKLLKHDKGLYKKFDFLLVISPGHLEDIDYNPEWWSRVFSVDWIAERITTFRDRQEKKQQEKQPCKNSSTSKYFQLENENNLNNNVMEDYENNPYLQSNKRIKLNNQESLKVFPNNRNLNPENNFDSNPFSKNYGKREQKVLTKDIEKKTMINNNHAQFHALVILDDVIADIKAGETNPAIKALFFNRRQMVKNVCMSFLIATQSYMQCPKMFRGCLDFLLVFDVGPNEIKRILVDNIGSTANGKIFQIEQHYKRKKHNFIYLRCDQKLIYENFETCL